MLKTTERWLRKFICFNNFSFVLVATFHHCGGTHNFHTSTLSFKLGWVCSSLISTTMILLLPILLLKHMSSLPAHIQTSVLVASLQICQLSTCASHPQNSTLIIRSPSFNLSLCSSLKNLATPPKRRSYANN